MAGKKAAAAPGTELERQLADGDALSLIHISSEVLSRLDASADGLSDEQAKERLEAHGPNQLAEGKKKSVAMVFLDQFKDLLVVILIIAAGISMLTGDVESTAVIIACLLYTSRCV